MSAEKSTSTSYYTVLGVMPSASVQDIRRAYRELSKLYHPDTTTLPPAIATEKFQAINEAYATLSSPDLRATYDLRNGYSRVRVMRPNLPLDQPSGASRSRSSAYLDPTDRPLSAGEIFALFILGITFAICLLVVVMVGATRGEIALASFNQVPVPAVLRTVLPSVFSSESIEAEAAAIEPQGNKADAGEPPAMGTTAISVPLAQPSANGSSKGREGLTTPPPISPAPAIAPSSSHALQETQVFKGDRPTPSALTFPLSI